MFIRQVVVKLNIPHVRTPVPVCDLNTVYINTVYITVNGPYSLHMLSAITKHVTTA